MNYAKIGKKEGSVIYICTSCCPSLTGKSKLAYKIHQSTLNKHFHLRIIGNTGQGSFPVEGIWTEDIENSLEIQSRLTGENINSFICSKDRNAGGFYLAVLMDIGLVCKETSKYFLDPSLKNDVAETLKEREKK